MAVYTEVTDEDLVAFLRQYDIGDVVSVNGIAEGIENSNFLLTTTRGPYILTLYERRVRSEDLPFFIGLMDHLAARGVPCPTPVRGRDGEALRSIAERPAAVVSFLNGMWPRRVTPEHCAELGAAMAAMHLAGADFALRRDNDLSVAAWADLAAHCGARADEVMPGLAAEVAAEVADLQDRWPRGLPEGVIHADLFPDNVFFLGGRLSGLIDFYFACNDAFAYDLAVCINAWCFEPDRSFNVTKAHRLLAAYRRVRPVSDAEVAALPILARGAALRFLLTRLDDWLYKPVGSLGIRKDPLEYWHKLSFHRAVGSAAAYGLA